MNKFKAMMLFDELTLDKNTKTFDFIQTQEMKDLIALCYEHKNIDMTEYEFHFENHLSISILDKLVYKNLLDTNSRQNFIDIMIAAAHLLFICEIDHNKIDAFNLIKPRLEFEEIMLESNLLPKQVIDAIFETIEARYGEQSPISRCKPTINTPQDLFAECFYIMLSYIL